MLTPNIKTGSIDFVSLSENIPSNYTTGFEVFRSSMSEAIILYSILSASGSFTIASLKRQIRKDKESNLDFNFTTDTLGQFMELSRG